MKQRSFRAEKEFGVIVGSVLIVLSGWWLYRAKFGDVPFLTGLIGALLLLSAIVFPRLLVVPNRLWMGLAAVLSYLSTRIILALVFFLILTPIGLIKKALGWDPLRRRAQPAESYWHPYPERQRDSRHYEKMY